jgi:hypothetical protein
MVWLGGHCVARVGSCTKQVSRWSLLEGDSSFRIQMRHLETVLVDQDTIVFGVRMIP